MMILYLDVCDLIVLMIVLTPFKAICQKSKSLKLCNKNFGLLMIYGIPHVLALEVLMGGLGHPSGQAAC